MKTKNNNPGGRKPARSGVVGGPNTLSDSTMKTRAPNQTIDYLLNEYTDEQNRLGDRYGEEPTQDILTDLLPISGTIASRSGLTSILRSDVPHRTRTLNQHSDFQR